MADKKISELPKINAISGSEVIIPIVHDGTTQRMDASSFAVYASQWSAKTGSSNTFIGNQTINGNLALSGNVEVGGMITAQQYNVTYVSSSVQYKSGSTEFGDTADDTHTFTGTVTVNGTSIDTTAINSFTASQLAVNLGISTFTGSQNIINSSVDAHILSISTQTGSQDLVNLGISTYTGSQNVINTSVDSHILSISTQTGSQDLVNLGISTFTGSQNVINSSVDTHILGISTYTASVNLINSSIDAHILSISTQTGSQDLVNLGISTFTGSQNVINNSVDAHILGISTYTGSNELWKDGVRGEVSGLEAYTASLKGQAIVSSSTQIQNYNKFALTASANTFYGDQTISGSLIFSGSSDAQTSAYAGGVGHMMMVDTERTDIYTENGSTNKPFKTLSAAITAANIANPTGTDPYTFVMMGCNINENISFNGTAFNFITLATTCRTVLNGTLTITNNPNLKQLIIRNLEFAQPVTITGDGTTDQMNDMSFYNVSFADTLNVSRANSLALWDVYSSAAVNLTNLNYLYVGGGQVTGDITIVADSTLPLPSNGMAPGLSIIFDLICNNLILTRGGTATYVLQPHNTRIGLNAGSYTIPTGFSVASQASTFRGTWTNNGTFALRNSSTDNAVLGTQPTYTGIVGGFFKGGVTGSILSTNGVVSSSNQLPQIDGLQSYTASLKGAIEVSGPNVNVLGSITAQQFNVTFVSSSIMYQSGSTKLGNSSDDKHEITGSLNTSFGGNGGLFVNDGFQKTFTFPTGNLFSIDFGSAEGGGFVDVTYGGVVTSIGGRGGATRYAIAYKNATDAVATKVHGYGDDIVSASISATKVAIFSIGGDAVQSAKYQVNVSINAVAADGAGDYDVIQYNRL